MNPVSESEARDRLTELLNAAAEGDEVVIVRAGGAMFRLVPVVSETASPDWEADGADFMGTHGAAFEALARRVVDKNQELYRRLT